MSSVYVTFSDLNVPILNTCILCNVSCGFYNVTNSPFAFLLFLYCFWLLVLFRQIFNQLFLKSRRYSKDKFTSPQKSSQENDLSLLMLLTTVQRLWNLTLNVNICEITSCKSRKTRNIKKAPPLPRKKKTKFKKNGSHRLLNELTHGFSDYFSAAHV